MGELIAIVAVLILPATLFLGMMATIGLTVAGIAVSGDTRGLIRR
jgi:hypothetical protein